jgi:hypothetical protein
MKKILLLILMLSVMLSAAAPVFAFEKGTIGLGGTVSYSAGKYSKDDTTSHGLELYPMFSYFVVRNLCVDVSPGLYVGWDKSFDTYTSFTIALGARYFYKKFYGGIAYEYRRFGNTGEEKRSVKYLKFSLGHLVGLVKNVYLDVGIDYTRGVGKRYTCHGPWGCGYYDNELREFKTRVGVSIFFK